MVMRAFWFAIRNAAAHPLLLIPGRWSRRFHDWTAERMVLRKAQIEPLAKHKTITLFGVQVELFVTSFGVSGDHRRLRGRRIMPSNLKRQLQDLRPFLRPGDELDELRRFVQNHSTQFKEKEER